MEWVIALLIALLCGVCFLAGQENGYRAAVRDLRLFGKLFP